MRLGTGRGLRASSLTLSPRLAEARYRLFRVRRADTGD